MLLQLVVANLKMLVRDKQSVFWAVVFPLIFVTVFGLFSVGGASTITLGVVDRAQDEVSTALVDSLSQVQTLEIERFDSEEAARAAVDLGVLTYRFIRKYVDRRPPLPLTLTQVDPLIRELTRYRTLIDQKTGEPT